MPDEGGVAEAAIAYAAGKPVLIYKNDVRTIFNGDDNAMVACLSHAPLVRDIRKLPSALDKLLKRSNGAGKNPYQGENIPPAMRSTLHLGRKVWNTMNAVHLTGGEPKRDGKLIARIVEDCRDYPGLFECEQL